MLVSACEQMCSGSELTGSCPALTGCGPVCVGSGQVKAVNGVQKVKSQRGFSLVEVSIVMAIVLLLAIIAIPAVRSYVIESRVPKVGEELARYILHTRINASSSSVQNPYAAIKMAGMANMLRGSSVLTVDDATGNLKVRHGLGSDGEVTVAEANAGAAFTITLSRVNHAACPSIASVLQHLADRVVVSSASRSATVKDVAENNAYKALVAEETCEKGDVNTFAFTVS